MEPILTKSRTMAAALSLALLTAFLVVCNRSNPFDAKSASYIPGKRPHVSFVNDTLSAYLYDTVPFQIACTDTTTGGKKGAIKEFYFSWNGDTVYKDSVNGNGADTFIIKKTFPPGSYNVRVKATDFDGVMSDADSITLIVTLSRPGILSVSVPRAVEKNAVCTLSVSALDTGGSIRYFLWAKNGTDFLDTTSLGVFFTSFADTGGKIVLVKVLDNKGIESGVDTVRVSVFEKLYETIYDGNGNTGGTAPLDKTGYARGQSVTVLGNSGLLVKTGYAFTGWNTRANGGGASYSTGAMFAIDTSSVTLFAQWAPNPAYTVTYNANGAGRGAVPTDSTLYTLGQSVTVLGNLGGLVRPEFTFIGWNTQANGSGVSYASGVSFTMGSSDITLYAQWTADPTFTVSYAGNGSSGGTVPVDPNNYTAGETVTVLENTGALAKTGFTFVGWNTQANGGGIAYATGVSFTMGPANVTLYAQWTANPTFIVTYNGNGNTAGTPPTDANSYLAGAIVTTRTIGNLAKTGYTFTNWNTQANGSGTAYAVGATFAMGSANITLYAQWAIIPTFTITYNGNGNTAGTVPADANNYTAGAAVTVLGNTGALVKTGSTFVGWNTQANGSGIAYAAGVSFTMGPANVTLYAQWTVNPTFTVAYDGNGSSGGTVPVDANNYTTGLTVTVLGNTGALTKTGFTFVGWNTKTNGSGTAYAGGATFTMGTANVILYAQWTANPTFIVTYNGNGNTAGTPPTDANSYLAGAIVTTRTIGNLAKTGYTFTNWNTQANGGGTAYAVGATFTISSANVTLYAQWTIIPIFTVTYDGNANTGGTVPADANNYTAGAAVTVLGNTGALVKTGSTFVGWNTQANGSGIAYAAGVSFTMGPANVTLYAQWTVNPTFTVAYDGNGSSGGTVPVDANNYTTGLTVTVLGNTGALTKTGFTFVGWNTKTNGSGTAYAGGATFTMGTANVILYAQWTANPTFIVTYNGNGNTAGTPPTDANSYLAGAIVTTRTIGNLAKTGYTFTNWNTQANGGGTAYAVGATFTISSANVTLYAQWTIIPIFTVTYDGNANTGGTVPADANNYTAGAAVTVLGNTGALVKTGSTFVGWNTQANGSGIAYAAGVSFTMGPANVTLYAQWTVNPTFTVAYDGNGNSGGTVPVDANNYTAGLTVTVLGNTSALAKTGFTFVGWNTKTNGSGTAYAGGATFTMGTANVILYAQWTANPTFIVTYNGNGNTAGTPPTDVNSYLAGAIVTTRTIGNLAKTGYTFTNWNTQANGGGTAYAVGATFTIGSANVTLYAQWAIIPTFAITYNGNANTGGTVPVDANNYTAGAAVTVLANTGSLVKTGSTFVGWNTQANGSGVAYTAGATFTMGSANVTLYAQWSVNPTYTVTYDGNGNNAGSVPTDANNYTTGLTVTVLGNTGALAKTGFTFVGWNTKTNGSGTAYAGGATFTMGTANVILYAQWTANPTFIVTYNGNGNTAGTPPTDANSYLAGAIVTTRTTGNLAKTGYTFTNWNTQANGGGTAYAVGATFTIGSANVTLYAQWAIIPTFAITYNGNANTGGTVPVDANNYTAGAAVTVLANTGSLVKTGSTFVGWNTQANGSGVAYTAGATFTMGSANVTLYAQWSVNPTYTVTYDGNGNNAGSVPTDANNYTTGLTVTVLGNTGALAKTGFTFVGWNTKTNGSGTAYAGGATFTMGTANVILYAQWTANPTFIVTYNGNGNTAGTPPTDANSYLAGAIVTTRTTGNLAKTGYTFTNWNTQANGGGTAYAVGATFTMGSANVTLYAQWAIIPTFTVTYNGNNSSGGTVPADTTRYTLGQTVTVLGNTGALVKTGFTFAGWNTQVDGSGISYPAGANFLMGSANVILFAQWSALPAFNIFATASANGSISPSGTVSVIAGTNQSFTVTPAANYHIADVQVDGVSQGAVATFTFVNVTASHAIAASFAVNTFTISASSGPNGAISPSGAVSVNAGSTQAFVVTASANFHVSDVLVDGISQGAVASYSFANITAGHTIAASFAADSFTVTYDGNNATSGVVPAGPVAFTVGQTVTVLNNTGGLANGLLAFAGWNTKADGTGVTYAAAATFSMPAANVILYAQWH